MIFQDVQGKKLKKEIGEYIPNLSNFNIFWLKGIEKLLINSLTPPPPPTLPNYDR